MLCSRFAGPAALWFGPMSVEIEIGRPGPWHDYTVDADAARAFAGATNDPDPRCQSGEVIPLLFTAALILPALWSGQSQMPEGAIKRGTAGVHAQHEILFHRPIEAGMDIKIRAMMDFVRQVKPGAMSATKIDVCDADEQLLRQHWWINIDVGGILVAEPVGQPVPDTTLTDEMRSRPLGTYSVHVDGDQTFRYSEATGESPPHSMSDDGARAEGFDRIILQGMCTFALAFSGVIKSLGEDPDRLRRLAGRFSRPCHPDTELEVGIFEAGSTAASRSIAWEAASDGEMVIKHGLAEFAAQSSS
jgi:acyl dehydratase